MPTPCTDRHVIISGCSGGGKSTLLDELARRGFATVAEPGRRIVQDEQKTGGKALPWVDPLAFAQKATALALRDRADAGHGRDWVFFDRGLIDAAAALALATGQSALRSLATHARYHRRVFMAPPWPEIYQTDADRRHDLAAGIAEYHRLRRLYPRLGYEVILLPKTGIPARADFVVDRLG